MAIGTRSAAKAKGKAGIVVNLAICGTKAEETNGTDEMSGKAPVDGNAVMSGTIEARIKRTADLVKTIAGAGPEPATWTSICS